MNFYERFFAQHKTFVLKIAIFFIYLLIIYPACPARGKKSDDSTCTSHRFFFLSAEDASCAERSRVSEILLLLQKASAVIHENSTISQKRWTSRSGAEESMLTTADN